MTRRTVLLLAQSAALAAAAQKKRGKGNEKKVPEIEVVDFAVRRDAGVLEFDGKVRNCGERPQEKVVLIFYVTSPDGKVVTTQKGQLDAEVLEPGEESAFQWQARDHVRGVTVTVGATNKGEDELLVLKPGPYPIE